MFDKAFLLNKIVDSLQKNEFEVFVTQGCFDIAARRESLYLLKVLMNVDGLTQGQALSLRTISYFISANPFIISTRNTREPLSDDTVYERFDVPVLTPKSFDEMLVDELVIEHSAKGRHTLEINTFALRDRRQEMKYTLEQLAEQVGMSKKALYEIENKRVNPTKGTVKRLEALLSVTLTIPYEPTAVQPSYLQPKDDFQKNVSQELSRIGIDNSSVYSAPFEIVGKERFSLITTLSENTSKIRRESAKVKGLSGMLNSKALFVARRSREKTVDGVSVVLEADLPDISSTKHLSEILEEA
mgnify:CR=1 FL=1